MSIPAIRYVNYSDEGCEIYECLNCYGKVEVRTGNRLGWDKEYEPAEYDKWKFCPYCGCQWKDYINSGEKVSSRSGRSYMRPDFSPYFILEKKYIWEEEERNTDAKWESASCLFFNRNQVVEWMRTEEAKQKDGLPTSWGHEIYRIRMMPSIIFPTLPDAKIKPIYGYQRSSYGVPWVGFLNTKGEQVRVDLCSHQVLSCGYSYRDDPPTALPDHTFVGRLIEPTGHNWDGK